MKMGDHGHTIKAGHGSEDNKGRSYNIRVTKSWCIIGKTKHNVVSTPISAEEYLRNEIMKDSKQWTAS